MIVVTFQFMAVLTGIGDIIDGLIRVLEEELSVFRCRW